MTHYHTMAHYGTLWHYGTITLWHYHTTTDSMYNRERVWEAWETWETWEARGTLTGGSAIFPSYIILRAREDRERDR